MAIIAAREIEAGEVNIIKANSSYGQEPASVSPLDLPDVGRYRGYRTKETPELRGPRKDEEGLSPSKLLPLLVGCHS